MTSVTTVVQSLGVAYAAGINLPATVAVLGVSERVGWIEPLPGVLGVVGNLWVISIAVILYALEFLVTLVPGLASAWETAQSVIRPPAAAFLAVATAYNLNPVFLVAAGLLGGGLALTTHGTKLGLRYAVDSSPEPVSNGIANMAELGTIASIGIFIWTHPYITLTIAILVLILLILVVRRIIITLRKLLSGEWRKGVYGVVRTP
ncbi:MAG TPA: DUF4126 domain-containing protein [Gemmatimonadaceae bacterium]|nr:DUF4126 domain-containing protein [Gemmatimonadaceae bacterium]